MSDLSIRVEYLTLDFKNQNFAALAKIPGPSQCSKSGYSAIVATCQWFEFRLREPSTNQKWMWLQNRTELVMNGAGRGITSCSMLPDESEGKRKNIQSRLKSN